MAKHPWVMVVSLIVGVVGILIAIFVPLLLYCSAQEERQLMYAVNPVRTTVVAAGQATGLQIQYDGTNLGDVDITAVQVALWNAGDESIRQENVLEDVAIATDPPVPILEASIRTLSRQVTEFQILDSAESWAAGRVPVSWRILEKNDGASVQLIYVGSDDVDISVQGVIEGRQGMKRAKLGVDIKTPTEQMSEQQREKWAGAAMSIAFGVLLVAGLAFVLRKPRRWLKKPRPWDELMVILATAPGFGIGLWLWLSALKATWPPFGF